MHHFLLYEPLNFNLSKLIMHHLLHERVGRGHGAPFELTSKINFHRIKSLCTKQFVTSNLEKTHVPSETTVLSVS